MGFLGTVDGVARAVILGSSAWWAIITARLLWRARVSGAKGESSEILLPIMMAVSGLLWAASDGMAWLDRREISEGLSLITIGTRIAAAAASAFATMRFAKKADYLGLQLAIHRMVEGAEK